MIEIINQEIINQDKALEAKRMLETLGSKFASMHTVMEYAIRMLPNNYFLKMLLRKTEQKMRRVEQTYNSASMKTTMYFQVKEVTLGVYEIYYKGDKVETLADFEEDEQEFIAIVCNGCLSPQSEWGWSGFEKHYMNEMDAILKTLRGAFEK